MADNRFSALSTDPRYRLPSRKASRTPVDPRFKRQFADKDFLRKASVDRYGRKVKPDRRPGLKERKNANRSAKEPRVQPQAAREIVGSSEDESDVEDEIPQAKRKDPAREGGFSASGSEDESSSDELSEDELDIAEDTAGAEQNESIPMGEVSRRVAAVNLDWDNVRAMDIMAVASSFIPADGIIDSVTIYPSEFGRERLEREELEGPPREIFASSESKHNPEGEDEEFDEDEEEEDRRIQQRLQEDQVDEGDEFNTAKLRQYQLERLRYYYAVIACSSKSTAKALYDSMDGREYLSSANFFDLRFIPDGVSFDDDKPKDECTKLPDFYKPNEFRTEALTHSKVRLTWDDDDTTRKEAQKRAFSRAEMDENDLKAYIGTDSSDADSVASRKSAAEDRKANKRDVQRQKMRAALGLVEPSTKAAVAKKSGNDEPVGDMQITFTSGLGGAKEDSKGVFENEPQDEESTRARYMRKERERKQKRKEKMKATRGGEVLGENEGASENNATVENDDGFDDPFFTDPTAAAAAEKKAKKADRSKKLADKAARDEEAAGRRADLELLMADDQAEGVSHFDMREIEKSEKEARRKGKKKKDKKKDRTAAGPDGAVDQDGFRVETEDPRFKALFESHEYAIDPTNPRFKKTGGMNALLEEGRKKRKADDGDGDEAAAQSKKATGARKGDAELSGLVKRLKGPHKSSS